MKNASAIDVSHFFDEIIGVGGFGLVRLAIKARRVSSLKRWNSTPSSLFEEERVNEKEWGDISL